MAYDPNKQNPNYPYPPPQYTPNPILVPPPPVITQQPVHVVLQQLHTAPVGPNPQMIVCPGCHSNIMTRVEFESTIRTHLMALGLCLLGCWPCVCIPYCVESCQSANHYCPNCQAFIGTYQG